MKKTASALALLTALTLPALSGCEGGNSGSKTVSTVAAVLPIVGTFRASSITATDFLGNRHSSACPGQVYEPEGSIRTCGSNDTFQFRQDGTFTIIRDVNDTEGGTYQYVGSTLTLKVTTPPNLARQGPGFSAILTNGNNTLTFPGLSVGGVTVVLTRQ